MTWEREKDTADRVLPDGVVCAACFDDPAIVQFITDADGEAGCTYCEHFDAPTIPLDELGTFMRERLLEFYSLSIEHLMYVSAEGGYQGNTWSTWELLEEHVALSFPRAEDTQLVQALAEAIEPDEPWCEYDPAVLDPDESMLMDWGRFCDLVKYRRRFFFHNVGPKHDFDDAMSPSALFDEISKCISELGLITTSPVGYILYRARPRKTSNIVYTAPLDLGPPPADNALQSNRMNPPGIPMFYGSEDPRIAVDEVGSDRSSLATFITEKSCRLLDLASLPKVPSIFSDVTRREFFALTFLRQFTQVIMQPVEREERTVLDYLPTQVFSEFLRDREVDGGSIDGVRYPSAVAKLGRAANVVLGNGRRDLTPWRSLRIDPLP